jgi:lipopolysaccharide/colanic/teichoic acid biosynthesis glycosyltransferase
MKRLIDITISLLLLLLVSPILLIIAVLIKTISPGAVLFKQRRVGRDGTVFNIFKFRSMVQNAAEVGSYQTAANDPRITNIGKLLRKTSLDELPQLLNVLLGDMSLIGPRPDLPAQRDQYTADEWQKRHLVRPGITGLAQATLRSAATAEQRKQLDLNYVDQHNLILDFKIAWWTCKQVTLKGSY